MNASKLAVKFFLSEPSGFDVLQLAPVFHRWIQEQRVPDHVLIDVADYSHVVDGPGVVLVSHEANFSLDQGGGRPGLLYNRKRPSEGTFHEHLRTMFRAAIGACVMLEKDLSGSIRFNSREFLFRIYDRLMAPNTPEMFDSLKGPLENYVSGLFGTVALAHNPDPRSLFEIQVKPSGAPPLQKILDTLS